MEQGPPAKLAEGAPPDARPQKRPKRHYDGNIARSNRQLQTFMPAWSTSRTTHGRLSLSQCSLSTRFLCSAYSEDRIRTESVLE